YFFNMTRDRLKPTLHQGFSDCTHVGRLKNRGKPHSEAVLIFLLGELQLKSPFARAIEIAATQTKSAYADCKGQRTKDK
ncbi:MAG: hypothetical protein RLO19_20195, partial [Coleofasciculus sp. G2-EDA-02]